MKHVKDLFESGSKNNNLGWKKTFGGHIIHQPIQEIAYQDLRQSEVERNVTSVLKKWGKCTKIRNNVAGLTVAPVITTGIS